MLNNNDSIIKWLSLNGLILNWLGLTVNWTQNSLVLISPYTDMQKKIRRLDSLHRLTGVIWQLDK